MKDASQGTHHCSERLISDYSATFVTIPDIGVPQGNIRLGSNEIRLGLQRLLPAKNTIRESGLLQRYSHGYEARGGWINQQEQSLETG